MVEPAGRPRDATHLHDPPMEAIGVGVAGVYQRGAGGWNSTFCGRKRVQMRKRTAGVEAN